MTLKAPDSPARCARLLLVLLLTAGVASSQEPDDQPALAPVDNVDWQETLSQFDLRWDRLPTRWNEAPFLGNGEQGTQVYQTGPNVLRFDTGCSAAHDHRPANRDDLSEKHVEVLNRGRHFIGHLELRTSARIRSGTIAQTLWNAQASGALRSASGGELHWRCIVHAIEPVLMIETRATGDLATSGFYYVERPAQSPRAVRSRALRKPAHATPVRRRGSDGVHTVTYNLVAGGQTAVAWKRIPIESTSESSQDAVTQALYLSTQHSYPSPTAQASATTAVRGAAQSPQETWIDAHREWWHAYYPLSFLSTGDPFWDSFYWIQQHKLGAATRDKGWIIDNQGPWLQLTAWSATWWNLNAQISHLGAYQANRRGQASALSHQLDINRDNLALNVAPRYRKDSYGLGRSSSGWDLLAHSGQPGGRPPMDPRTGHETGNLLWALHNVDLECRYWQDKQLQNKVLYPLLVRAVNYYRHFLEKGEDGLLHLPPTHSPEYRTVADCSYDLDLLRWGVHRLIALAEEQGEQNKDFREPLVATWRTLARDLAPTHEDDTGRMIGRGVPLKGGHRHWSHLLAIYPLRTLTPDAPDDRTRIARSLQHWRSFGRTMAGYSSTGSACMAAILGDGDRALEYLDTLKSYLQPNTLYSEAKNPVMETPLHGATAMQEMVLQSWGGTLRVFPAVPHAWPDVQFARFRADGGYLVSARREQGATRWVEVYSETGGAIDVDCGGPIERSSADAGVRVAIQQDGTATIRFPPRSRAVLFTSTGTASSPSIQSIPLRGPAHAFGLRDQKPALGGTRR